MVGAAAYLATVRGVEDRRGEDAERVVVIIVVELNKSWSFQD